MRPRVVYISYDGASEPLGQSQIVAYLEPLADLADITLVSFEKAGADHSVVETRLRSAGIRWIPLDYHRRPPVASTWWDVARGVRILKRVASALDPDIIHVRSYVAALIAYRSGVLERSRLLFDIRGFWADERVDGGIWRRGILYRIAKAYERRFFDAASAVVTLTDASVPQIRAWLGDREVPVTVIPTCVDVARYESSTPRPDGPHAVWNGSIGTWYRFDLAVRLAGELRLPFTVLTRQTELAEAELNSQSAEVKSVTPHSVPDELHEGDIGLCLIKSSYSKIASAPTRFAEHLAAGNPVAVTPQVGDLERIVARHEVGVVVRDESDAALREAAAELLRLAANPQTAETCRRVARDLFALETGVKRYASLYQALGTPGGLPAPQPGDDE